MERRAAMIQTAHLTLDALGMMAVKTTYDEQLVTFIREIPGQRRCWYSERWVWLLDMHDDDYLWRCSRNSARGSSRKSRIIAQVTLSGDHAWQSAWS
jgi:hypothetical protein